MPTPEDPRGEYLVERMTTMTRDQFHAMLIRAKLTYQPADDAARPAAGDVVTVTRETEGEFAVWRLEGETWARCGTIAVGDDARAWNASQMERFWNGRTGSSLQLGCLQQEPPSVTGGPVTRSELAGPVESIMRVVHLAWMELHGDAPGYRPLWCDDVDLRSPQTGGDPPRTVPAGNAKRGRGKERTCTVVDVHGSGRALRWA
jgi:hypothetical protein